MTTKIPDPVIEALQRILEGEEMKLLRRKKVDKMPALHSASVVIWRRDVDQAPPQTVVLTWGGGGCRFMTRDPVGQWRSITGRPKTAPKLWAAAPKPREETP